MTDTEGLKAQVPDGTAKEITDWVGEDPDRVAAAIAVERAGKNRTGLLTSLELLQRSLVDRSDAALTAHASAPTAPSFSGDPTGDSGDAAGVAPPTPRQPAQGDPQDSGNDGMCAEHFPLGWNSPVVTRTEAVAGPQHEMSCEHGTYRRPVKND